MTTHLLIPWFEIDSFRLPLAWMGEIEIHPFGFMVALGILVASFIAMKRASVQGIQGELVSDLIVHVIPLSLLLAYILNPLFYHPNFFVRLLQDPSRIAERYLGLSSYGGILGGCIGGLIWQRRRRESLLVVGDPLAFAFPMGWFLGRTGCFMVHDHPGIVSDFFLAVDDYRLSGLPRHDLGLYEALFSLGLFGLFLILARKPKLPGFFLGLLPALYGPARFLLDFLRASPEIGGDTRYHGLTPAQYGSMLLMIIGWGVLWRIRIARFQQNP